MAGGTMAPSGILRLTKTVKLPEKPMTVREMLWWASPRPELYYDDREVFYWRLKNWPMFLNHLWRFAVMVRAAKLSGYPFMSGKLFLTHMRASGQEQCLGLVSLRAVTDVLVNDIVDEFDEATDDASLKTFNYHGIGTGTTGAVAGDTDLETELTTEYTGDVRATGAQSQPSANIYQTLATNTLDSGTPNVTEHGVLTSATVGAGTLQDRHTFAAKNIDGGAGEGLQSTYQFTVTSGG